LPTWGVKGEKEGETTVKKRNCVTLSTWGVTAKGLLCGVYFRGRKKKGFKHGSQIKKKQEKQRSKTKVRPKGGTTKTPHLKIGKGGAREVPKC